MKVAKSISDLSIQIADWKKSGLSIGFVPTMGYLHDGHLELLKHSKSNTDKTVICIFVNPTQFNDPKDFLNYPFDEAGDLKKCESVGVDLVFLPNKDELYPNEGGHIVISQSLLQKNLCGRTRPGHFEGVMLIVAKLFHLVSPNKAFFGLKDFQQYRIIQDMVKLLNFPIEVVGIETIREKDGLALSSRNVRLNSKERETATLIPRAFALAEKLTLGGETSSQALREILADFLLSGQNVKIDYIETVDPISLQEILVLNSPFLLAMAVFVGETRLIDNRIFTPNVP
ncbi:MAG: pantoate--beta-alanine ligase [Leptospira sp.]|nr:pantoate--beta-alanine ligase [Leptospira sp.]